MDSNLNLSLFLFLLFIQIFAVDCVSPPQPPEIFVHILSPGNNDTEITVTGTASSTLDLVCPPSHPVWFLPHQGTGAKLVDGNRLRISLTNDERAYQRGFYTCCPNDRVVHDVENVRQMKTPECCPCCPWPEEEACSNVPWNASESFSAPACLRVFVYTGAVSRKPVTLNLPWEKEVLIPCPLPAPKARLRIYSELLKIKLSKNLWFDSGAPDAANYDPRLGLCIHQKRVPGQYLQLSCEYDTNVKRKIKPQMPHAPPTLLPNVSCSIAPMEHELALSENNSPLFRIPAPRNLSVSCSALYANMFIAKRPPSLCFRWRIADSFQIPEPDVFAGWSHFKCVKSALVPDTVSVSATQARNLTAGEGNTTVEIEVVEQNRVTDHQLFSLNIVTLNYSGSVNEMILSIVEPDNPNSYRYFPGNESDTLVILEKQPSSITMGFFTMDEIVPNTTCYSPNHDNSSIKLIRNTDKWLCQIQLQKDNPKFETVLMQSGLIKTVIVYPSLQTLLPRVSVHGLRGSITSYVNVTCPVTRPTVPDLIDTDPDHVMWSVYRGDMLLQETMSNLSESILQIAPLVSASAMTFESLLDWDTSEGTHAKDLVSKLALLTLPPAMEFSRRLCVTCEVFFSIGSSKSPHECVTLELRDEPDYSLLGASSVRRFSSRFLPTQITNTSSPSFRIIKAYPTETFNPSSEVPHLSVYSESLLELRCSVSRTDASTAWPLIYKQDDSTEISNDSLPLGHFEFYALPFALESRLLINDTDLNSTRGVYVCGDETESPVRLSIDVVAARPPVVIEPNQPVRYFAAHEIIRLTCQAIGEPKPTVAWYVHARVNASDPTSSNTTTYLLKKCENIGPSEFQSCNLVYMPSLGAENITIECEAENYMGKNSHSLQMIRLNDNTHLSSNAIFKRMWKNYVFWIIASLVAIVVFIMCVCFAFWRKSRQVKKADKLIKMNNLIYARSDRFSGDSRHCGSFYNELLYSLMPTEELRERWCIDRNNLRPFPQPLGSGHYGMVQKGIYYAPDSKRTKQADTFFVALKSPSAELSSLTCFRNEIAHLMRLSGGPNIVKMIGCAFGEKEDLRDTLLVLEFCPNTSLSDFIRRMLYPRSLFDHKPMYVRNAVGGISAGSCQTSTTPVPSSESPVSQFAWDGPLTGAPVRILRNDYDEELDGPSRSTSKNRRGGRRNTSLVYQRLTRNSSSIFLQIAKGIARGLEFLAENSVIHRDLATRNILMDSRYEPKICDLGLAVTIDSPEKSSDGMSAAPSGCYHIITFTKELPFRILPPEALSKQLFYLTSDIWEFGLLLWQMFFFETRKPFEGVPTSDALLRLLTGGNRLTPNGYTNYVIPDACSRFTFDQEAPHSIDRPPAVPNGVWGVICDCLRVEANERPSAKEVRQRLEDCFAAYEENADGCTLTTTVSSTPDTDYQLLCRRESIGENIYTLSPAQTGARGGVGLSNYENIGSAADCAGYLESFPSSSL